MKEITEDARIEDRKHFEALVPRIYELGGKLPDDMKVFHDISACPPANLHEEIEQEAWFAEFPGKGPSGHFRRRGVGESPFVSKFPIPPDFLPGYRRRLETAAVSGSSNPEPLSPEAPDGTTACTRATCRPAGT